MNRSDPIDKKLKPNVKKRLLLLGLTLYLFSTISLLVWINHLQPQSSPQLSDITLDKASATLSARGQHLSDNLDAVLSYSPKHLQSVIYRTSTWSNCRDIKIRNEVAWVVNRSHGLVSYDLSNPRKPQILGSVELPAAAWNIALTDHYALITAPIYGLLIVDISQPEQPKLISQLKLPGNVFELELKDDTAVIAAKEIGIHLIDISNKETPTIISTLPLDGDMRSISLHQSLAYVSGFLAKKGLVFSIDISTLDQPQIINRIELPQPVLDSEIINNRLYCGTHCGLYAFDIDKDKIDEIIPNIDAGRLFYTGKKLFIMNRSHRIYEYAITQDTLLHQKIFVTNGACRNMSIYGSFAFIINGRKELSVIDLDHPGELREPILTINDRGRKKKQLLMQDTALLIKNGDKLHIAKKNQANTFEDIDTLSFPQLISNIIVDNSSAYLSLKKGELYVVDLANQSPARQISTLPFKTRILAMERAGKRLFLCLANGNILSVDISDRYNLKIVPEEGFTNKTKVRAIKIRNNICYIATDPNGLEIYALQKGAAPKLLSQLKYPPPLGSAGKISDIGLKGNFIFIASDHSLLSVDVSVPTKPVFIDSIESIKRCEAIHITDQYLYLDYRSGSMGGMGLIDISDPKKMKQLYETDRYEEFTIAENKIVTLEDGGLTIEPLPRILEKQQISSEEIIFRLPAHMADERYDLYFSDAEKLKTFKQALMFNDEQGWELTQLDQN